jgi:hypothetical protein
VTSVGCVSGGGARRGVVSGHSPTGAGMRGDNGSSTTMGAACGVWMGAHGWKGGMCCMDRRATMRRGMGAQQPGNGGRRKKGKACRVVWSPRWKAIPDFHPRHGREDLGRGHEHVGEDGGRCGHGDAERHGRLRWGNLGHGRGSKNPGSRSVSQTGAGHGVPCGCPHYCLIE